MNPIPKVIIIDAEEITIDYWTRSAKGYKKHIQKCFQNEEENLWLGFILAHAPKKEHLRVLDIGTGPGFFTIILNRAGHDCTGIDATQAMVDAAKDNAKQQNVKAEFKLMNADDLEFPDETFDLIINRNVTWTLPDMEVCYKEWRRVLAPNGMILVVDANYYCNQFDKAKKLDYLRLMRQDILDGEPHADDRDDFHIRAEYWETRPMAGTDRPTWDANVLYKLRFVDIVAQKDVPELQKEKFKGTYELTKYFIVSARKPSSEEYDRHFLDEYREGISGCMSAHSAMALENGSAAAFVASLGIPGGRKVLDFGCNGGAVSVALSRAGCQAYGTDTNKTMVLMAGMNVGENDDVSLQVAVPDDMPFEDGTFDAVVMRNSVWALHEPEKAYSTAFKLLKKGGVLYVADGPWKKALADIPPEEIPMYVRRDLGFGGTSMTEDVMSRLPLTNEDRPEWDMKVLERVGFEAKTEKFRDPMMPPTVEGIAKLGFLVKALKRTD